MFSIILEDTMRFFKQQNRRQSKRENGDFMAKKWPKVLAEYRGRLFIKFIAKVIENYDYMIK